MVLFFLPHAGGSAKSYCSFKRFLPRSLTVVPMEIAGRSTRSNEPLFKEISDCCRDLIERHGEQMAAEEYAIFGHSMGTLLTCELVRQAREKGLPEPVHVFLSGRCSADEDVTIFSADEETPDSAIMEFFFSKELFPQPAAGAEELMAMITPILCTDVRMADKYRLTPRQFRFNCDVTVMYGREDEMLKGYDMHGWQRMTAGKCSVYEFSGAHFYYQEHKEEICRIIAEKLLGTFNA